MFRLKKKRTKPASLRLAKDDETDEDEGLNLVGSTKRKQSKEKRKSARAIRSFPHEDEDTENDNEHAGKRKKSRKKTKKGLGFGGSQPMDDHEQEDNPDGLVSSGYDSGSLSRLLAEQRTAQPPRKDNTKSSDMFTSVPMDSGKVPSLQTQTGTGVSLSGSQVTNNETKGDNPLPDYLPLDGSSPTPAAVEILTGAEAFQYSGEQVDIGNDEETNKKWEAEVGRRAGLDVMETFANQATCSQPESPELRSTDTTQSSDRKSRAILAQLRNQVEDTIQQIRTQQQDMNRRIERQSGELASNEATIRRHKAEIETTGSALEFFQQWRNKLCLWVGAMLDLKTKVEPILDAMHELEGETAAVQRWIDWENDMVTVLRDHELLAQVLGREPPQEEMPIRTVDEFGRDVKSRHAMHRERRRAHRRRIHEQHKNRASKGSLYATSEDAPTLTLKKASYVRGDESDAFVSDGEEESFRERHGALQIALDVAIEEIDENYTLLQNLVNLFDEWYGAYPEEYAQCFASLSLADLAGVLVQAELCSLNDPWNESAGYNEAKWTSVIFQARKQGLIDQPGVDRLFEKWVLPTIADLFAKRGVNLTSSRQTRSMSNFLSHVQKLLETKGVVWGKLCAQLIAYTGDSLNDVAIPIVKPTQAPYSDGDDEVSEARYCATWGQLHRIKKLLTNVLTYWAPLVENDADFVDTILHFASSKFLFLLSSLKQVERDELSESPDDVFRDVYCALQPHGWLDYPEFMLQAAPLRAAAGVYNVSSSHKEQ